MSSKEAAASAGGLTTLPPLRQALRSLSRPGSPQTSVQVSRAATARMAPTARSRRAEIIGSPVADGNRGGSNRSAVWQLDEILKAKVLAPPGNFLQTAPPPAAGPGASDRPGVGGRPGRGPPFALFRCFREERKGRGGGPPRLSSTDGLPCLRVVFFLPG